MDEQEVPWFDRVPEATLHWSTPQLGHLHFYDPKGKLASVPVTKEPSYSNDNRHVWHIEIGGDQATVSPSIHYVGEWHSPNPVVFSIVEKLRDGRG